MEQKFDIGLNAKITEFTNKFGIDRKTNQDDDVFEDFGNYIIASVLLEEELEKIKSVSTNKAQGIDGIVFIVNDKLISEESDLVKFEQTDIVIKIGFIQSTIQKSFDEQKLSSFTDEVVKFLTGEFNIEPYSTIYKKLVDETGDFINRITETPCISLFFLSARTSHNVTEDKINAEKTKITSRSEIENRCHLKGYHILQKDDIKSEYDKISKFHTTQLRFENNITLSPVDNVELSFLTTIKFSELKKLILTSDGNLKDKLFVENVRSYIGETSVNKDIRTTLNDAKDRNYFPFLNNGLVIICDCIKRHPVMEKSFELTFPRIINGCQTSNELFKKYKGMNSSEDMDNVEVVAKVIATKNNDLKRKIIYSANNQNPISKDLQSLNEFNGKIEEYFVGKEAGCFRLYFERLRGLHSDVVPPYSKVDIETLARVFISVFLKKPHEMKTNALSIIDRFQREGTVFNGSKDKPEQYYYCGILWYWFNNFLINKQITMKSKTMDMHILMACDILLENRGKTTIDDKISYLDNEQNAKELFIYTTNTLNDKSYLFERRGLYSNPKTDQLIKDLTDANTPTNN